MFFETRPEDLNPPKEYDTPSVTHTTCYPLSKHTPLNINRQIMDYERGDVTDPEPSGVVVSVPSVTHVYPLIFSTHTPMTTVTSHSCSAVTLIHDLSINTSVDCMFQRFYLLKVTQAY